jgi:diguanylate cyclase (GGDEF)-like protein
MDKLLQAAGKTARGFAFIVGLLAIAMIGLIDYYTGYRLALSTLYLIPILFTTWHAGRGAGLATAGLGSLAWGTAEALGREEPLPLHILVWNVSMRLVVFVIVTVMLARIQESLEHEKSLSRTDNLTGLLNGRAFLEAVGREVDFCSRNLAPFALAYIDLDDFKQINDRFGHAMGDTLLMHVARCFSRNIRGADLAARLGGDEFSILLPHTGGDSAEVVINRLREDFLKEMYKNDWPVSLSIGLVSFELPPPSAHEAVKLADGLMYEVKRQGKNAVLHQRVKSAKKETSGESERRKYSVVV